MRIGTLTSSLAGISVLAGAGAAQAAGASPIPVISVKDYGAVGDGVTDCTVAVQTAINAGGVTYFPSGTYKVSNLSAVNGMQLVGAGTIGVGRSRLRASSGSIFQTSPAGVYGTRAAGLVFDSFGGGGDLFTGLWSLGKFEDCCFAQYQNNASCFNVSGWIDMLTIGSMFDHTLTATMPTFKAVSASGEISQSSFLSCRFTNTGDYAIHLEGTNGSVVENISIREINFEEPKGGAIRLLSARNTAIQNPGMWDFTSGGATKHLIYIGTSPAGGSVSSNNEIGHYVRDASSPPAPDVYDIKIDRGTEFTTVRHARHQMGGTVLVDMMDTSGMVIGDNATVVNATFATIVSSRSVKFPRVTAGQRPTPSAAGRGAITFDESKGVPIYSDGTVWRKLSDNAPA